MAKTAFRQGRKVVDFGTAIVSLTDSSTGSASDVIAAIGGTYDQDEVRDAVASLAAKVNAIIAALEADGTILT